MPPREPRPPATPDPDVVGCLIVGVILLCLVVLGIAGVWALADAGWL